MTDEQIQEIIDQLESELENMDPDNPQYQNKQTLLKSWQDTLNQKPLTDKESDDNKYYVP